MNFSYSGSSFSPSQVVRQPRFAKSADSHHSGLHHVEQQASTPQGRVTVIANGEPVHLSPEEQEKISAMASKMVKTLELLPRAFSDSFSKVFASQEEKGALTPGKVIEDLDRQAKSFAAAATLQTLPQEVDSALERYNQAEQELMKSLPLSAQEKMRLSLPVPLETSDQRKQAVQSMLLSPLKMAQHLIAMTHAGLATIGSKTASLALTNGIDAKTRQIEQDLRVLKGGGDSDKAAVSGYYKALAEEPSTGARVRIRVNGHPLSPDVMENAFSKALAKSWPQLEPRHAQAEEALGDFHDHLASIVRQSEQEKSAPRE